MEEETIKEPISEVVEKTSFDKLMEVVNAVWPFITFAISIAIIRASIISSVSTATIACSIFAIITTVISVKAIFKKIKTCSSYLWSKLVTKIKTRNKNQKKEKVKTKKHFLGKVINYLKDKESFDSEDEKDDTILLDEDNLIPNVNTDNSNNNVKVSEAATNNKSEEVTDNLIPNVEIKKKPSVFVRVKNWFSKKKNENKPVNYYTDLPYQSYVKKEDSDVKNLEISNVEDTVKVKNINNDSRKIEVIKLPKVNYDIDNSYLNDKMQELFSNSNISNISSDEASKKLSASISDYMIKKLNNQYDEIASLIYSGEEGRCQVAVDINDLVLQKFVDKIILEKTGCPAMSVDTTIDGEDKKVYLIKR